MATFVMKDFMGTYDGKVGTGLMLGVPSTAAGIKRFDFITGAGAVYDQATAVSAPLGVVRGSGFVSTRPTVGAGEPLAVTREFKAIISTEVAAGTILYVDATGVLTDVKPTSGYDLPIGQAVLPLGEVAVGNTNSVYIKF